MGTEKGYGDHLVKIVDAIQLGKPLPPPITPSSDWQDFGGGSVNHRELRVMCWYLDARFAKPSNPSTLSIARRRTLHLLARQKEEGLSTLSNRVGRACEILSPTHSQLSHNALAAGIWAAAQKPADLELMTRFTEWWQGYTALHQLLELPGARDREPVEDGKVTPLVWTPGERAWLNGRTRAEAAGEDPIATNSGRDLCYRLIQGLEVPPPERGLWHERYYLGARCLSLLPAGALKALRPPAGNYPQMPHEFHIDRFPGGDFFAFFKEGALTREGTVCAGVESGKPWVSAGFDSERARRYGSRKAEVSVSLPGAAQA